LTVDWQLADTFSDGFLLSLFHENAPSRTHPDRNRCDSIVAANSGKIGQFLASYRSAIFDDG
jgi:hypothetical protein